MQRVMIVDALITNPAFLVADNVTQPLDVTIAAQILRLLKELQRDFRTSIVFVSSALGVVNEIADRVVVLAHGRSSSNRRCMIFSNGQRMTTRGASSARCRRSGAKSPFPLQ